MTNSDSIYGDALSKLGDLHKELSKIIAEIDAEDERVLKLLEDNHRKIIKPLSDTCIRDARTEGEVQVGERVMAVKDRIDTVEAEVASLWDQWENAQKEVDDIFAELSSGSLIEGARFSSVTGVQASLAGEMAKFGDELTGILEDAHEEARASEKVSLVDVLDLVHTLTSCRLELFQENQWHHVGPTAAVSAGGLSVLIKPGSQATHYGSERLCIVGLIKDGEIWKLLWNQCENGAFGPPPFCSLIFAFCSCLLIYIVATLANSIE